MSKVVVKRSGSFELRPTVLVVNALHCYCACSKRFTLLPNTYADIRRSNAGWFSFYSLTIFVLLLPPY